MTRGALLLAVFLLGGCGDRSSDPPRPDGAVTGNCNVPADPPVGARGAVPGYVLRRGFLYPGAAEDTAAIARAARANALATVVFFQWQADLVPEVPEITIREISPGIDGVWVEYEAAAPQPDGATPLPFVDLEVPVAPWATFDDIIHDRLPECPSADLFMDGLQHLAGALQVAPAGCRQAVPLTDASLSRQSVSLPRGDPRPAMARWLADCTLHVALFFNRLGETPDPQDVAWQDRDGAHQALLRPDLPVGALQVTAQESPLAGVHVTTLEGTCRTVGGATCVDLRVDLAERDLDHASQTDPNHAFWSEVAPRFLRADVVYWLGHGFRGLAFDGLPPLEENQQLLVLNQCSSAASFAPRFFAEKPDADRDLDLIGFAEVAPLAWNGASTLLTFVLQPDVGSLRDLAGALNALRDPTDPPFVLVGSLFDPSQR